MRRLWLCTVLAVTGCELTDEGIPPGKLAVVGPVALGPGDLDATQSQLGAYGQLRFSGQEAATNLLDALVTAEILALEARRAGFTDDPRVEFALLEEIAAVRMSAELERRVPFESVSDDTAALRAYYDAHPGEFGTLERRSVRGVVFDTFEEADAALAVLRTGTKQLKDIGEVFGTPLQPRQDLEYPGFHWMMFAPDLAVGDWIEHPVFVGESLMVARVEQIEASELRPFEDAKVQQELVAAVRAPRIALARDAFLAELRERASLD